MQTLRFVTSVAGLLGLISLRGSPPVFAYEKHSYPGKIHKIEQPSESGAVETESKAETVDNVSLLAIGLEYQMKIAPLFHEACTDCHSGDTRYPWYFAVPGIRQWMQNDIEEAREHIEFSNGYPFQSQAQPEEDLLAIAKVITNRSMPPLSYRIMHRSARLSQEQRQLILDWTTRSQKQLQDSAAKPAR